jgi:hypothetical protein
MKALKKGAYIKHFQYTDIDFDLHGMKKFVTTIMVVDHAEGEPPVRRKRARKKVAVSALKPVGVK